MKTDREIQAILVEDDVTHARAFMDHLLDLEGFSVSIEHAGSLREAIDFLSNKKVDVIFLELNLPDSSGLKTLDTIFKEYPDIPVVVFLNEDDEKIRNELFKSGAMEYLIKNKQKENHTRNILKNIKSWREFFVGVGKQKTILNKVLDLIHLKKTEDQTSYINHKEVDRLLSDLSKIIDKNSKLVLSMKNQNIKFEHLAHHDPLTNLSNRLQFEKALTRAIAQARRHDRRLALLLLDLDNFKLINDSLGHQIGDLLLKEVSARLALSVREEDFIARLGGDEFAIILSEISEIHVAGRIAQKLIILLNDSYQLKGHSMRSGASIGIAIYPEAGQDAVTLTKNADLAMYNAKKQGRNNYQYFRSDIDERYKKRTKLENSLNHAIESHEFYIVYQPRYKLQTGELVGLEALLRWNHQDFGTVMPGEFIFIAEEVGMIELIDQWVLKETLQQIAKWRHEGFSGYTYSINLSARELLKPEFALTLHDALKNSGLNGKNIMLEFSEESLMREPELSAQMMRQLMNMNVRIAIDNFGVGHSSLLHLTYVPVHALMIDQLLVQGVEHDPKMAMIVKSVIKLANDLGIEVIAEGVETKAQYEFLKAVGCDEAHGHYFSRPLSEEQATALLVARNKK